MATRDRAEMLKRVREKMLAKKGGYRRDPSEFKPPQVGPGKKFKARGYILPPTDDMDGLWFLQIGDHWVNRKKHPCPRVYDGDKCSYCQLGFDLLSETSDKESRSDISKAYLPRTQYVVNIWFPPLKGNPEDLQDEVKFYAMPKTIFDKLEECIIREDAGDDEMDPQPWGLFYDETQAYPLSIEINRKGDFNSYEKSKLLAAGLGPIADSDEEIEAVLDRRHDLSSKYPERTPENLKTLQGFVDALLNGGNDDDESDGFDADETATVQARPVQPTKAKVKTTPKKSKPEPAVATVASDEVEDEELASLLNAIKNDS